MIQAEINGEPLSLPELRCYHKLSPESHRLGAVIAAEDPFGKTWVNSPTPCQIGSIFEMEIPGPEDSFVTVRMRCRAPAERGELIRALHKSPRKLTLAKGYWYEVIAD